MRVVFNIALIEPQTTTHIMITLDKTGDKEALKATWIPCVRFQIDIEKEGEKYIWDLTKLFADFIRGLSSHQSNQYAADRFYFSPNGQEGGVGGIYIGQEMFHHCKLYGFDGTSWEGRKGILMRDHTDLRSQVRPIYELAEKFEEFLRTKEIPFQRFGRQIDVEEESEQISK